jgi:peptide/nickel transport system substrate-binding protein
MKKGLMILLLIAMLSTMLSGCGGGQVTKADELIIAVPEEIQSTDMHQITWNNVVHDLLYEPIVVFDLELNQLHPAGCKAFEVSEDGKSITFTFDTDAKFSNGDPLDAEAVKKSFERYIEISPYGEDFDPITEMIVVDAQTLKVNFEAPPAFIWPVFATSYGGIVNVDQAEEMGKEAFGLAAVGNGPYYVDEWVQGSHITLLKNPYYKSANPFIENKANFDKVTIRFIPEDFTRVSELEAGTVDIIVAVPVENIATLEANTGIQLYDYLQTGIDYLVLNTQHPDLREANVRHALSLAVNKDELKQVLNGTIVEKYGIISPAQLCYDAEVEAELKELYKFDLETAKGLLAAAGWTQKNADGYLVKDGKILGFTMMVTNDAPFLKKAAPVIQEQWKALGVKLDLNEYDSRYIRTQVTARNFEIAMRFNWWTDPDILYYVLKTGALPWSSAKVDQLLEEARYEMNMETRTGLYGQVQTEVLKDMPIIPLFSERQYMAAKSNIEGLKVAVDGKAYLGDVIKK